MHAEGVIVHHLQPRHRPRIVEHVAIFFCRLEIIPQPLHVVAEQRHDRAFHLRVGHALPCVIDIARRDLAPFPAGETRVVVKRDAFLQMTRHHHAAVGQHLLFRHRREHPRHHLERLGLPRLVFEQRVIDRFEDDAARRVVAILRVQRLRLAGIPDVARSPRLTVLTHGALGRRVRIVAAAAHQCGDQENEGDRWDAKHRRWL